MTEHLLTRAEIISLIRQTFSLSARESGEILESLLDTVKQALVRGQEVRLLELGRFKVKYSPPRQGRNPRTGAVTAVPAQKRAVFSASQALRRRMAKHLEKLTAPESGSPEQSV
jgi:nucleoid DNA-binding protein